MTDREMADMAAKAKLRDLTREAKGEKDMKKLYTMYDIVAETGLGIFEANNDHEAIRKVKNDMEMNKKKYPIDERDYELYYIGDFDKKVPALLSDSPRRINWRIETDD